MAKNKVDTNKKDEVEEIARVEDTKELISPEMLEHKIDNYFNMRITSGLPSTLEGLCLYLDCEWETFIGYLNKDDELGKIIKRAYLEIKEARVTEVARVSSTNNVEGNWLLLKNMSDYGCKYE